MARVELDEIVTGLGLLGNVLSIPRQLEAGGIENEQQKALLKEAGYDEATIAKMAPQPRMRWLSAGQPGFGGKVLGGVGDVGSILTTIVGKPIKAPRMEMSDIANMTTLRTKNAQAAAQKRLGAVILDPKSTPRDIAAASVEAGNTSDAIRLLRPDAGGRMPASVLGLRGYINSLEPGDPKREKAQQALDDQLEYKREEDEEADRRIRDRQPPHYNPAETKRMQHDEMMRQRDQDAQDRGFKKGTPEYEYYMSYGHPRVERQPRAEPTFEEDVEDEQRRRDALAKNPRTAKTIPTEPVEDTVRRNRAARAKGKAAEKSGEPIPGPPPPPPKRGAAAGAAVGGALGGEAPAPAAKADDADAQAMAVLKNIDFDALPPEIQEQVKAADKAGMPKQALANWLLSLQPPTQ